MPAWSKPAGTEALIPPAVTGGRLASLDLFRGATIAAMILVKSPGNEDAAYWPLKRAEWNGWTPHRPDLPFLSLHCRSLTCCRAGVLPAYMANVPQADLSESLTQL